MTPEQLREAAAVMLAAADGKKIERRWKQGSERAWEEKPSFHHWNFDNIEYRIKPEPRKARVALYKHSVSQAIEPRCVYDEKDSPFSAWKRVSDIVEIEVKE